MFWKINKHHLILKQKNQGQKKQTKKRKKTMGQHMSISGKTILKTRWGSPDELEPNISPTNKHSEQESTETSFGKSHTYKTEAIGRYCTRVTPACPSGGYPDPKSRTCTQAMVLDKYRAMLQKADPSTDAMPVYPSVVCDTTVCDIVNLNHGVDSIVYTHHGPGGVSGYCMCDGHSKLVHPFQQYAGSPDQLDIDCASNKIPV